MYKPPFTITNEMLIKSISIVEKLEKIKLSQSLKRNNKIKSIYSTLAIEANSLSIDQVKDVIARKIVIGPANEIQEVKNAYKAYEMIKEFDGYSEKDLLKAHGILTNLIIDDSGKYRNHREGVFDGDQVIFVAPPENIVPDLMKNLFDWLKKDNKTPMLLKSCIFHYEFVFIHPFSDGNGRTARLWQNVLLTKLNPIFEYLPIESQIQKHQAEYYDKIAECHSNGNSDKFIEFMLKIIDETLDLITINVSRKTKNG